jgi:hypothetical protein
MTTALPAAGKRTQSLNRYAYALNNPTTLTDPSGLFPGGQPICMFRSRDNTSGCGSGGYCATMGCGGGGGGQEVNVIPIVNCDSEGNCTTTWQSDGLPFGGIITVTSTDFGPKPGPADFDVNLDAGGIPGFFSQGGSLLNGLQTPRQAATQYCQQHGQLSFNIPHTHIPVTISLSGTLGPANYSATNDINTVFPLFPWPEWLAAGASVDFTINAPAQPMANVSAGFGKNLSVGYFEGPSGPQGISLSVGPSIGPPINISVPTNNACGMLAGGN